MSEELRCIGCGSILQDQDPKNRATYHLLP